MVVIILEKVAPSLRGELTRWLIEPHHRCLCWAYLRHGARSPVGEMLS